MTKNASHDPFLFAYNDTTHDTEGSCKPAGQPVTITTSDLVQLTKHKHQLQALPTLHILQVTSLAHNGIFCFDILSAIQGILS